MTIKASNTSFSNSKMIPFSVTNLPNINIWIDASDASTVSLRNGFLTQIDSKLNDGKYAFQGTESLQPPYSFGLVNGLNAINFPSNTYALGSNWEPNLGNWTIFLVVKCFDGAANEIVIQDRSGTSNNLDSLLGIGNMNVATAPSGSFNVSTQGPSGQFEKTHTVGASYADGNAHMLGLKVNGFDRTLFTDLESITETKSVSGFYGSNITVAFGGRTPTLPIFSGVFCELIACKEALSDLNISDTKQYLISKWGI